MMNKNRSMTLRLPMSLYIRLKEEAALMGRSTSSHAVLLLDKNVAGSLKRSWLTSFWKR